MIGPRVDDPVWLQAAWACLGQKEIPGPKSNLWIEKLWLARPGGRWFWEHFGRDDSKLPWCGAFTAHCFASKGIAFPRHYQRALAWAEWGKPLGHPIRGCVVIFNRAGGGHVGFVVGVTKSGNLLVLGGNQNDAVAVVEFPAAAHAFRWPSEYPTPTDLILAQGSAIAVKSVV